MLLDRLRYEWPNTVGDRLSPETRTNTIARARGSVPPALPAESETISPPAPRVEPHESVKDFLGVVLARISTNLAPRFEGRLREVRVRLGDRVRKDSVMPSSICRRFDPI